MASLDESAYFKPISETDEKQEGGASDRLEAGEQKYLLTHLRKLPLEVRRFLELSKYTVM